MTAFDRLERQLPELLTELSAPQVPDYLTDILSRTARTRQRPGWTSLERWLPMSVTTLGRHVLRPVPWRAVALLVALAVLIAAAAVAFYAGSRPRLPSPYGPAANGSLLFDRGGDIYSVDLATRVETALVSGATNDVGPAWSRDGTKFVFSRSTTGGEDLVMSADADGSNVRQLTSGGLVSYNWVDWSPNGTKLLVYHNINRTPSFSILEADGTQHMQKFDLGKVTPQPFALWLPPKGDELIFLGDSEVAGVDRTLYRIRADGSGLQKIVGYQNDVALQNISLSPDGSKAYFWSWEQDVQAGRCCWSHRVDLTTNADERLNYGAAKTDEIVHAISPDGNTLVVEGVAPEGGGSKFMIAPVDGSAPGRFVGPVITATSTQEYSVAFSPDGKKLIVFEIGHKTRLVDVASGATEETTLALPRSPDWQRKAS